MVAASLLRARDSAYAALRPRLSQFQPFAQSGELRAALSGYDKFKLIAPDLDPRPTQAISQLQWHALACRRSG